MKLALLSLSCLLALITARVALAGDEIPSSAQATQPVAVPTDGANLVIIDALSPDNLVIKLDPPTHNLFFGNFVHLSTAGPTTFNLSMDGNDTERDVADTAKWVGLKPLFAYSDPTAYSSYEWFAKDASGRWVSGDPLKTRR